MTTVLVNGVAGDRISVTDRGFNYGDGVFETIALVNRKLHFWPEHYQRLAAGCAALAIVVPEQATLLNDIQKLDVGPQPAVVKIVVSRGEGGRGYSTTGCGQPTVVISLNPWPERIDEMQQNGIQVYLCRHPLVINPALAGIKHLNRIDQVLARNECQNKLIQEGLMTDLQGQLIEGTASNLFAVKNKQMITAPAEMCAVAGIVRQAILGWAGQCGLSVTKRTIAADELLQLDELFVCNSIWGILPITQIHSGDDKTKSYPTGAITQQLRQLFTQSRETDATAI